MRHVGNVTKETMLVAKNGTLFGDVPGFIGTVFYVNPIATTSQLQGDTVDSSDDNSGLLPQYPLRTVQAAINKATQNNGDVIAILNSNVTSSLQVLINKAGLTFVGVHNNGNRDRETTNKPNPLAYRVNWASTFAGTHIVLSVANVTFIGIRFVPLTARTMMSCVTCPRTMFYSCDVELTAAVSVNTKGIVASGGSSDNWHISNCTFYNGVSTSAQGPALDVTGVGLLLVENCTILMIGTSSAWAVAIQCGSGTAGIFRNNTFTALGAGTMTVGVDGTGVTVANSVMFQDNKVGVSPGVGAYKNFDADSATTANCLTGVVSGGGTSETSNHLVI